MPLWSLYDAAVGALLHMLQVQHQQDQRQQRSTSPLLALPGRAFKGTQTGRHGPQVSWLLQLLQNSPCPRGGERAREGLRGVCLTCLVLAYRETAMHVYQSKTVVVLFGSGVCFLCCQALHSGIHFVWSHLWLA